MRTTSPPRVALCIGTEFAYDRDLISGIGEYLKQPDQWRIYLMERRDLSELAHLGNWEGGGVIASIGTLRDAEVLRDLKVPAVGIGAVPALAKIGQVQTNVEEGSVLVADHFLERGLTHFAFVGWTNVHGSRRRRDTFIQVLRRRGIKSKIAAIEIDRFPDDRAEQMGRLSEFLAALPKPSGVFAVMDNFAVQVMQAAQDAGLHIPDDLAVVGAHNDEALCSFLRPSLSSLEQNSQRLGFEAASLLSKLMKGEPPPLWPILVSPIGVVARESSDIYHSEDPDVASAFAYIRENACEGIGVDDVVKDSDIGRSNLERRFRQVIGRTIGNQIRKVRLDAAKELLRDTDLPLVDVAIRTGFEYATGLSATFARVVGMPPGEYRKVHRTRSGR